LKQDNIIQKFKENTSKIINTLHNEITKISQNVKEIKEFTSHKKFNKYKFENNRKLENFLNSLIQFYTLGMNYSNTITNNTIINNNESFNLKNLSYDLDNILNLINELKSIPPEKYNFIKYFESEYIKNILNLKRRTIDEIEKKEIKSTKICFLCLNKLLNNENHSNIFSYDFHVICINFWLNTVDNKSPYEISSSM
jgi:hypothetical protein